MLQVGTTCLVSLVTKKNQNELIQIEEVHDIIAFQQNLESYEFMKFQIDFGIFGFVTGWHNVSSFFSKIQNDPIRAERGVLL